MRLEAPMTALVQAYLAKRKIIALIADLRVDLEDSPSRGAGSENRKRTAVTLLF
jgi:hypothetical protein